MGLNRKSFHIKFIPNRSEVVKDSGNAPQFDDPPVCPPSRCNVLLV